MNLTPSSLVGGGVKAKKRWLEACDGGGVQVWGAGEGYRNQKSAMHIEVLNLKGHYHMATCKYEPGPI